MEQNELQQLAKELVIKGITEPEIQKVLISHIDGNQIVDQRDKGHYCLFCGTTKSNPMMGPEYDKVIFPKNYVKDKIILITHTHYDGCNGWD